MNGIVPNTTPKDQRESLANLVRQIAYLTAEQQNRLADIALGMALQKEIDDERKAS